MEKTLEDAIVLATHAHAGQKDKVGMPVILHPIRVMLACMTPKQMMVGILHDVVEDTNITLKDLLKDGYPEDIVNAVDSVSKRDGESWEEFIGRCSKNQLGAEVKFTDISDNMSPARQIGLGLEKREELRVKYQKALKFLGKVSY
jgi:(p)ppGpp synthase/HD superfamily hydrolase